MRVHRRLRRRLELLGRDQAAQLFAGSCEFAIVRVEDVRERSPSSEAREFRFFLGRCRSLFFEQLLERAYGFEVVLETGLFAALAYAIFGGDAVVAVARLAG